MAVNLDKLKNDLLEGLQDDVHEASQNCNWIEEISLIAEQAKMINRASSLEELKDIGVNEMLFEEDEWDDYIKRFKEKR